MKKSLVALAVLAASSASFAQSNVTLYGLVDLWVGSKDDGTTTTTQLGSGGVNTSRWGMKGSEDLGGGLKANFQLEQGISADDGAPKGSGFDRQAWVGFSGGFGEVRLGNTGTPYDDVAGASHAVFDSALSPTASVFGNANYVSNPKNMIYYQAPDFGGISGAVSYGLKEATALTNTSFNLTYAGGPLGLQLGYQVEESAAPDDITFLALGATFAVGPATLKASYGANTNDGHVAGLDSTDMQFGVDYAVSPALTVSASYATTKFDSYGANAEGKRSGFGIGAAYTLSKRTFL